MDEINELLDELYISMDRMDSKEYKKSLTGDQYKRLVSLGLPIGGNKATLWAAVQFLEEKLNGSNHSIGITNGD